MIAGICAYWHSEVDLAHARAVISSSALPPSQSGGVLNYDTDNGVSSLYTSSSTLERKAEGGDESRERGAKKRRAVEGVTAAVEKRTTGPEGDIRADGVRRVQEVKSPDTEEEGALET